MGLFDKKKTGKTAAESKLEEKIKRVFSNIEFLETQNDNGTFLWTVRNNSAIVHIFINTDYGSEENPVAEIWSPCVVGARDDDKLYRFLIEAPQSIYASWTVLPAGDGTVTIIVSCPRPLNTFDDRELSEAFFSIVNTADQLDDEIMTRFGGQRAQELHDWKD